jgi:hypothetical protein
MIFAAGAARITFDDAGSVVGVHHQNRPEHSYLLQTGAVSAHLDGKPVLWSGPEVQQDKDEMEVSWQLPGHIRLTVRHTFAAGWGMRLAFTNLSSTSLLLDQVVLSLRAAPDNSAWALAAGSEAAFSVHPAAGTGPVLGGVLKLGSVKRIDAVGVHLGRIQLVPEGRYILSWQWDWFANSRAFGRGRHSGVPPSLFLITEEPARITANSDTAVLAPGLEVIDDETDDTAELIAHSPGVYNVELRSSTGSVAYQVSAADPAEDVLAALADRLLGGSLTPAGVPRVDDAAAGLVLQHALTRGLVDQRDQATDALDRLVTRLSAKHQLEPLAIVYLAGQAVVTGEPDLLGTAAAGLLDCCDPAAGLGLALLRVRAASLVLGGSLGQVPDHMRDVVVALGVVEQERADADPGVTLGRNLDALELLAVMTPVPRVAPPEPGVLARVARLGARLGGGLKGVPVEPVPLVRLAQLAVVFGLLPEQLEVTFRQRWLCSPGELARRAHTEVLNRCVSDIGASAGSLGDDAVPASVWVAAAWLALDQSTAG